jgi:hypothetical protein
MKNVFALVAMVGLIACGSNDPIDMKPDTSGNGGNGGNSTMGAGGNDAGTCECPNGDGTRLTRQYLIGADGSKMETVVWHDNKLGLNCAWQSLPNGQTYCVPPHESADQASYFDAACTKPLYRKMVLKADTFDCLNLPSHVRFGQAYGDCPNDVSSDNYIFYSVGKLLVRSNAYYEVDQTGNCVMKTVSEVGKEAALWETTKIGPTVFFTKAVSGVGF